MQNCGECLMNDVEVVELNADKQVPALRRGLRS
jgi:hypothetical protein